MDESPLPSLHQGGFYIRAAVRFASTAAPALLQAGYKSLWLVGVLLPHTAPGGVPAHAVPLVVIFAFFIVGDLVAVPYSYVFAEAAVET